MTTKRSNRNTLRQMLALGLVAAATSGCASFKPPTEWFAKDPNAVRTADSGITTTLANTGKGIAGQFKSMGTAVSSAYGKTKTAVATSFNPNRSDNGDQTSLANMPTNLGPEIWVTNGQLYESQSNFAKALDNYSKALELEPNNEAALLSIARLYARQNQHAEAVEMYAKAIAVKPEAATCNELALSYQSQNRMTEAQQAVRQAISLDPNNPRYRNNLAGMLVVGGRSDEAVKELEQVFPPAVANYNVAYLHFTKQNIAAAQQHLQIALQIDPNLGEARELMRTITDSSIARTAAATYQSASSIYRTAEGLAAPTTPANNAVYQMQPGTANGTTFPSVPQ